MRTTLTIDDDVLTAARAMAEQQHRTIGDIVSDLARLALRQPAGTGERNGIPLLPVTPSAGPGDAGGGKRASRRSALIFLLDVNVLIAFIDPTHVYHDAAHDWFERQASTAWATCPLTENGVVRIVGNPRYPNCPGSPSAVADILRRLRSHAGHVFWPDDLSLLDARVFRTDRLLTHGQVTDSYLLGLAVAHAGRLASFDKHIAATAVIGGRAALHVIS